MSVDHAIVIGGSFGGLTAARVLSDHFGRVTIVERDEFPSEWAPRKGVPQSPHVHGIMRLGRQSGGPVRSSERHFDLALDRQPLAPL